MTDTDDTDELLLIPPDFFVVESDSGRSDAVQPYYNIVNKLIKQVDSLQNRLKTIEDSDSFLSNSFDFAEPPLNMNAPKQNFRKYNSTDDLQTSYSFQTTPLKSGSKFKISSLPNSPVIEKLQHPKSFKKGLDSRLMDDSPLEGKFTRLERDEPVLGEIDTFLTKVKSIQRLTAARNLENDFNNCGSVRNDIKHQNSHNSREEPVFMKKSWPSGDNNDSSPDDRNSLCREDKLRDAVKHTNSSENTRLNHLTNNSTHTMEKTFTDSSSDSSQITAYIHSRLSKNNLLTNPVHSNALNVLNIHKQLVEDSDHKISHKDARGHKKRSKATIVGDNFGHDLGLMNLADIWNANSFGSLNNSQLTQKLQEEKYRRQHCENIIQGLQTKNLELQQKLSVAVKVDEAKNKTIQQFQDALEKIIVRIEKINKEKEEQADELNRLKNKYKAEKEEADQKISHYEKEASKALNIAHVNQEKSNMLENKCLYLEKEIQLLKSKLNKTEENYAKECEKYKQMSEILAQKEIEMNDNKNALSSASAEIAQSRKTVEDCQKEFNKMKEDYIKMDGKLAEERDQTIKLNKEILDLLSEKELRKKLETDLQAEITKLKKQLESNKIDLRNFYQGQVEILVQNKLKEFQCQLDQTENNFKEEINKREMAIAKSAASHIQQISEKYSLEIKLLETKHQEEIKLKQIQVMQYKQQTEKFQNKLEQFQEKRITIAKQLQKVMESQWNEALRIISNGKSPTFHDESAFSTIDQLNSLRTKSYNNLEEVLSHHNEEDFNFEKKNKAEQEETGQSMETPFSSRIVQKNKPAISESEIQKYIDLLLNKPMVNVANPTQEELEMCFHITKEKDDGNRTKGYQRERTGLKPPWK